MDNKYSAKLWQAIINEFIDVAITGGYTLSGGNKIIHQHSKDGQPTSVRYLILKILDISGLYRSYLLSKGIIR